MKKWLFISLKKSSKNVDLPGVLDGDAQYGLIMHHRFTRYTRLDKIIDSTFNFIDRTDKEIMIFITGKVLFKSIDAIYTRLMAVDKHVSIALEDLDLMRELSDHYGPLKSQSLCLIAEVNKSRLYEKDFNSFAQLGGTLVAFNVDTVTKGHLVTAKKFNLNTLAYGVLHERQKNKVIDLDPEQIALGQL